MIVQGDNLDGKDYVVCVPDGTVDLVSWCDLSIERSRREIDHRDMKKEKKMKKRLGR
jgi:hypothetical protein